MIMRRCGGLAVFFLFVFSAPSHALESPALTARVNDYAHLLTASEMQSLGAELEAQESVTGDQVVILTLPGLEGEVLEEFSIRVARAWGLGQNKKNNGVLLLIAQAEHQMRIEVGYGLEGALTDAESSAILHGVIGPHFKNGDYARGLQDGVRAIHTALKEEGNRAAPQRKKSPAMSDLLPIGIILLVLFASFLSALPVYAGGAVGTLIGGVVGSTAGMFLVGAFAGLAGGILLPMFFRTSSVRGPFSGGGYGLSGSSGWSPRSGGFGGGWGGSGGGFSGGGGSFGGGGASGQW